MSKTNDIVVLTGFGLFRDYKVNPSWEAVKLIDPDDFEDIQLIKIEIPVAYDVVEKAVQEIWTKYKPILVIHCGVSHLAKGLHLESRAVLNVERYCEPDIFSCKPNISTCNKCTNPTNANNNNDNQQLDYVCCQLDLERIRGEVNAYYDAKLIKLPAIISDRVGEFLCGYIYRCSLTKDCNRTLFIHVPNLSNELTADDLAECLTVVIQATLKQIKKN